MSAGFILVEDRGGSRGRQQQHSRGSAGEEGGASRLGELRDIDFSEVQRDLHLMVWAAP